MIFFIISCVSSVCFTCYLLEVNVYNLVKYLYRVTKNSLTSLTIYILRYILSYLHKNQLKLIKDFKLNKIHELSFSDGSNEFCIRFPIERGPQWYYKVSSIISELEEENVTSIIHKYAGPSHNFYGIPTTPNMLGYKSLSFHLRNGIIRHYDTDDIIVKE